MLARANCTFNIPSLNDDTELNCRLYFPKKPPASPDRFVSGFIILAHPYAPLGGCYDDPIVQSTGSIFLSRGFVLCTFNFRGAAGSPGSTSWTGKGELADYVSVYTFMLHLVNQSGMLEHVLLFEGKPLFVLGGYSYGSMIASHLPDFETVQATYEFEEGSPDQEIELRAQELAKVLLGYLETQIYRGRSTLRAEDAANSHISGREVMMGGRRSQSGSRRISRDSARDSIDTEGVRHSIDRVKNKLGLMGNVSDNDRQKREQGPIPHEVLPFSIKPFLAYLLISPLLPPVAGFTTVFSKLVYERKNSTGARSQKTMSQNLTEHPTLAIFGDKDMFTSIRKLRKWDHELRGLPESRFTSREITGAGHFWHEDGAHQGLVDATQSWVKSLVDRAQPQEVTAPT